jgi:hypothetical protein
MGQTIHSTSFQIHWAMHVLKLTQNQQVYTVFSLENTAADMCA